ncbi:SDR family oxidoreductase [Herpetosiphon giganteus]|uniref:SDR family oxidoreductase n=1 Tax=Herpetosiphon giganteus TaxID=2029754 RepID=UPI0019589669|nr:complex I NDUFA9 subunit family protein [Herpetosiphon giganteus]MBM7842395.1 NADH dehydrogenase [Herpetosiphon giganteus]
MILVTGGTGYVGSRLIEKLRQRPEPVRVLVRTPEKAQKLVAGNISIVKGDVTDPESLLAAMKGVSTVIHLVAIIRERSGGITFERMNYQATVNVVDAAKAAGVKRFLHMSALGVVNDPNLPYMDTKFRAQKYVEASGLEWTVFQPSVIFGEGDEFINTLADLVRRPLMIAPAPFVPVVGDGKTKFQPVWRDDVIDAFIKALDDRSTIGQIYQLGGPDALTYEQMLDLIMQKLGKKRSKIYVPVQLMKPAVFMMDKILPKPPVTPAQLTMLSLDNSAPQSATEQLIGHPPLALRDGIDYIKKRNSARHN